MEDADLNPEVMAVEIGRSVTTIRNYLAGRTVPTRAVLVTWSLRCGVDLDWLATGIEEGPGAPPDLEVSPTACNGALVPFQPRQVRSRAREAA
jgi:transcriptional regulator with XRE-family HTH domain